MRPSIWKLVDSNVTTLVATVLLFWIGSGPVQGFAVTMAFGIVISMFTAVSVVHAIMATWVARRRPARFTIGSMLPAALSNLTPRLRFMRARWIGIAVSLCLSVASLVSFVKPGLNINETLARSLHTSATALLAMLPIAIWGGAAVQSFAIPMVFGIVIAASSSIFIAAPSCCSSATGAASAAMRCSRPV